MTPNYNLCCTFLQSICWNYLIAIFKLLLNGGFKKFISSPSRQQRYAKNKKTKNSICSYHKQNGNMDLESSF